MVLDYKVHTTTPNYALQDVLTEGPAHGWGFTAMVVHLMNNFTWCTADNPTYASNWLTATGNVAFYFPKNWSRGDTIWYITYDTTHPKYANTSLRGRSMTSRIKVDQITNTGTDIRTYH